VKWLIFTVIGIVAVYFGSTIDMSQFGTAVKSTDVQPVAINSNQIKTYFTKAGDHPETALANLYDSSKDTLDIAAYSLTYPAIVKAITDAKKRGVSVRVVTDSIQASGKSQQVAVDTLILNGITVKENSYSGLMHLKMSIIDGKVATTGSFNYSANAAENNEEMLVVISEPQFVQRCMDEFHRMWVSTAYTNLTMSY
jgi:phosphatidylserine/phosphatidylglycerophosphate/cardiolipin synthase-like enzyme